MINEDIIKSMKYTNLLSQTNLLESAKDDIENAKITILENKEDCAILDGKVSNLTVDDLKNLTDEEIEKIFTKEDGSTINLQKIYEDDLPSVRREFLKFCVEGEDILTDLDKEIKELNKKINLTNEEIDRISNIDFVKHMKDDMQKRLEEFMSIDTTNMTDKDKRNLSQRIADYKKSMDVIEDTVLLNNIYDNYKKIGTESTLRDYHNKDNSLRFYKKYKNFSKFYGIQTDLTRFGDLEKKFLSEKYHKYPNLFLFLVIKYYAYKPTYSFEKFNSVWLVQFNLNIYKLFMNQLDEETKKSLLSNIEKVLDLFITE